jgi:dipeptide transport system substrate-binding protein
MKVWAMPVARPYMLNARRAAELIQSDFDKVGVKVEIVSYEWAEYLDKSKAKDRDGAVMLGWTGDNGDPDNFLDTLLGCDAVGGNNRAQWCNKEFDDLVTKAKETSTIAERTKLYEQAQVVFKKRGALGNHRPLAVDRADAQGSRGLRPEPARRLYASTASSAITE